MAHGPESSLCWFFNGLGANKGFYTFMNKVIKKKKQRGKGRRRKTAATERLYTAHKA